MSIHQGTAEQALAALHSSPAGLSAGEAARRLNEFGANRLQTLAGRPLWRRLADAFAHFFALILWLAAALAFFAEHQQAGAGMALLGWAIIGVVVINGGFSFWQEARAERAIEALQKLLPHKVLVRRDGELQGLDAEALVPGDVLQVSAGDDIAADCRLLSAQGLSVNSATLTGESRPQNRDAEPESEANGDPLHSRNLLLAGTTVLTGAGRAVVFATGMHTEFGQIAALSQRALEPLSPLQRQIVHLSRWLALLATALGGLFFAIGLLIGLPVWADALFAIGIIVANVPEGLLPTVTLALAMATQRMAARGALIRHLPAVETLGATTVICTDKTGTLTCNQMRVREIARADGEPQALATLATDAGARHLLRTAAYCHGLQRVDGQWQGDAMELALVDLAEPFLTDEPALKRLDELPFDSVRLRHSVLCQFQDLRLLYSKGALEALLPLCRYQQQGEQEVELSPAGRAAILSAESAMAARGLRVLALAWRRLADGVANLSPELEQELVFCALVGLADPPRPEVAAAIGKCHDAGIKVIMVTGDHPQTALAIGREIGLIRTETPKIVTGASLRQLPAAQLQLLLSVPELIFARTRAEQKMRIIEALQRKHAIVAMTGDGVNDAPALRAADIGIAMGGGTDAAKAAADMVLLDNNFATIVSAIEEGRAVYANIRKFLTYILTSNIPEIVPYLAFVLFKIPLPLTVIQILAIDLGTDMLPALALGAEPPDPGLMRQPPRPRRERLLNTALLLRAYLFLGLLETAAALALFFYLLDGAGWVYGQRLDAGAPLYQQATTVYLSTIIVMQIVNVYLCRSADQPFWRGGLLRNRLLLAGIALELALILFIDYSPLGNRLFGTAPIGLEFWLLMLPCAGAMALLEEARKWLVRRWLRGSAQGTP